MIKTNDPNLFSFTIDVTGELSGETFKGKFTTKLRLSHRDQMFADRERRRLLGDTPEYATARCHNQAEVFSRLMAHLVDSPSWWREADHGLDLVDDDVVAKVYAEIQNAISREDDDKLKKVEEAQKDLEKIGDSEVE
jgi:hypothetical protein